MKIIRTLGILMSEKHFYPMPITIRTEDDGYCRTISFSDDLGLMIEVPITDEVNDFLKEVLK